MTKRKYGHGSLYQRQSDGRWIGRLPDGRGGYRYTTGTDEDQVRRRLEEMRRERDRTTSGTRRGGERLRDMIARWQATVDVHNRPKTQANNAQLARDHVNPAIGGIRAAQLELDDIQRLVNRMHAVGRSRGTIENAVGLVRTVLRHGITEGSLTRDVTQGVRYPAASGERLPSLTTDELRRFLDVTRGEPLWPAWVLLGTTAMRVGELLGLRWRDIGPDDATATISGQYRTVVERDAAGERTALVFQRVEPKTPGSRRTLHLPTLAREAIRVQRAQATSAVVVFARPSGEGPVDRAWLNRRFHDALVAHGFTVEDGPTYRLHSLRSTAIVAVLEATGGNLLAAREMAGHENIQTTIRSYASVVEEARVTAAEAMDRALRREAK